MHIETTFPSAPKVLGFCRPPPPPRAASPIHRSLPYFCGCCCCLALVSVLVILVLIYLPSAAKPPAAAPPPPPPRTAARPPPAAPGDPTSPFIGARGGQFYFRGRPHRYVGANMWYAQPHPRAKNRAWWPGARGSANRRARGGMLSQKGKRGKGMCPSASRCVQMRARYRTSPHPHAFPYPGARLLSLALLR